MVCQPLRLALLIGAITAVAVSPVKAGFRAPNCCNPCGPSTTGPAYRSVGCTEWVRETYTTKRTAYKMECRTETYDTFKTECVPVCKERTVCVTKRVPVVTEQVRKVMHNVTVYEDRIVNKTSHKYVQETVMKKQLVRLGHWETREVPALFGGIGGGLGGGLFGGHGHGHCGNACSDACADPCKTSNSCSNPCRTRTVKKWVHCPEYRCCPVTVCKKVCVTEAVKCKVAVCKQECREEKVKVCTYQCVKENVVQKYTAYETRKVACKATRTVRVCVPYEETVTACRLVPRTVAPACGPTNACGPTTACGSTSNCGASNDCCGSRFGNLFSRIRCGGGLRHNAGCGARTTCCN